MADVLPFPERNPRCINCRYWYPMDGPRGFCEWFNARRNCDWHCEHHAPATPTQEADE